MWVSNRWPSSDTIWPANKLNTVLFRDDLVKRRQADRLSREIGWAMQRYELTERLNYFIVQLSIIARAPEHSVRLQFSVLKRSLPQALWRNRLLQWHAGDEPGPMERV